MLYIRNENNFDNILSKGIDILKEKGLLKKDDTVVLSGGFPQETKRTFLSNHATGTILKI